MSTGEVYVPLSDVRRVVAESVTAWGGSGEAVALDVASGLRAAYAPPDKAASELWPQRPRLPGPPEPEPLPIEVLPAGLRAHVESVAAATQTPPDMAAMLALAAVSAAVRGTAEVVVDRRAWRELVTLYTVVVLPPATRKSAVYAHMVRPLETWEVDACARVAPMHRAALATTELAERRYASQRDALARGIQKAPSPDEVEYARLQAEEARRAVPTLPRVLAGDATPEALVRLLAEQDGHIALMAPEADPLGIADGRYSESARIDELLRAWCGETIRVDRVGREPVHVERPALTLGLTMQPEALRALRHGRVHRGRGLWGRILWCCPPDGLGHRLTGREVPALDEQAAERYDKLIRSLLDATQGDHMRTDPTVLRLGEDALNILYQWEAEVEVGLGPGGIYASIRDYGGKLVGQAVRLAALLEMAGRADPGVSLSTPIGAEAMGGAVHLARALATHAQRVLGAMELDRATEDAMYVLRRARELPPGTTLSELRDATRDRPGLATKDDLQPIVDDLTRRGCLRLVERDRGGRPGRPPSPIVELHPDLRTSHAPPNNPGKGDSRSFRGVSSGPRADESSPVHLPHGWAADVISVLSRVQDGPQNDTALGAPAGASQGR